MKGIKILAWVVGSILVLVALALAVGLNSSFQTWAVRKAVAGQPGMTIEVAKVSAGFSAAEVQNLRVVKNGMVITARQVNARYSAWDYLSHKRINVESLVVDQAEVDLRGTQAPARPAAPSNAKAGSAPAPTPASKPAVGPGEKAAPFEGLLKSAQLPVELRVVSLTAKGRALLTANQVVTFDLKAADIETGRPGKVNWTVDFADSTAGAELRAARATGSAQLTIAADRRINAVALETTVSPLGPRINGEQLKVAAKAEKAAAGNDETYFADLALIRAGRSEPLLKVSAQFLSSAREIAGTWDIAIRSEQLAGLLGGLGLPELAANGAGKFRVKPDTTAIAATGDLQANISRLQQLNPAFATLGAVQLKTSFDGGLADNVARLEKLNIEVAEATGRKFAQINSLQKISYALADKRVTLVDPKAELARISLLAIPLSWAQAFVKPMAIDSGELSMVLAVEAEPDGSRIRTRAIEPLAFKSVTLRNGDKKLVDRVSLSLRPNIEYSATKLSAQIADVTASMPDGDSFTANIKADVTNLATTPAVAFAAQLQAKVVAALKPYVPVPLGPLTVTKSVEGRFEGQSLQFTKVNATATREGNALLTSIDLLQPVHIDVKTTAFVIAKPTAPAVRVKLGEVPLAWAEPYVAKSKLTGALAGTTLEVALRSLDDVTLTTTEPLVLRGVTASIDGKNLVQSLDLTTSLAATKKGDAITYDVRQLEVKQGQATLAALKVAGEAKLGAKLVASAKGNLEADAATLTAQPALASFATLSTGRVTAAFDAALGDAIRAKAELSARNLVAKADNRPLGDLELNLDANLKPDGSGSLTLPVTLTTGTRKSDISVNGAFGRTSDQKTFLFTGKISSNQLLVEDFQPLASLAPKSEPAKTTAPAPQTRPAPAGRAPTTPVPPAPRDTVPFWNAVNGKFEVDLKRVVYNKDYEGAVRGTASITPSRLALDGLEGKFKDKPFKLVAGINFVPSQPKPYNLTGNIDISGVELGPILQAANPQEKPTIETTVRVAGRFAGAGINLSDLLEVTSGQFDVTGGKGVLRAVKGKAGTAVGVASLAGALLGAATGHNSVVAGSSIAAELREMEFDSFTARLERDANLNIKLSSIEFLSPTTRLTGSGSITHQPNVKIPNQPMYVEMRLAGKGSMLRMLDEARVLGEEPDEKGYGPMRAPFKLEGTMAQISDNLLIEIGKAALSFGSELRNTRPTPQNQSPTATPNQTQRRQQFR